MTSGLSDAGKEAAVLYILGSFAAIFAVMAKSTLAPKMFDGVLDRIMHLPNMIRIIKLKLRQDIKVVKEIDKQSNGDAIKKLRQDTEIVDIIDKQDNEKLRELMVFLQEVAPNEDGTINIDLAIDFIKDCVPTNNKLILKNKYKKLKSLEMKK